MGMRVALTARREGRLAELASEIRSRGGHAEIYPTDLRRPEMIPELFDKIKQRQGAVRLLVNNAGLGHNASLLDGGTEEWREMLEVNVLALCACIEKPPVTCDRMAIGDKSPMFRRCLHTGCLMEVAYTQQARLRALPHRRPAPRTSRSGLSYSRVRGRPGFVRTEFAQYHKSEAAADATASRYEVLEPDDVKMQSVHPGATSAGTTSRLTHRHRQGNKPSRPLTDEYDRPSGESNALMLPYRSEAHFPELSMEVL